MQLCAMIYAIELGMKNAMFYFFFQNDSIIDLFYGDHLGNDVIKKANVMEFKKSPKQNTRGILQRVPNA